MLLLAALLVSDLAVAHTEDTVAVEASRVAHAHLHSTLPWSEAALSASCARDPACPLRPTASHVLLVGAPPLVGDPAAAAGVAVHLELIDATGVVVGVEDVSAADAALLKPALAPALDRLATLLPAPPVAALPAADKGGANGWLIAGAVVGGGCVVLAGVGLISLAVAGTQAASEAVSNACGTACSNVATATCLAPTAACIDGIGSFGDACSGASDSCTNLAACDVPSPSCDVPSPSCDVPSPDCNVGSCALAAPLPAGPGAMQGLRPVPTEEAAFAQGPMAY